MEQKNSYCILFLILIAATENGVKDKKQAMNFLNSYKWSSYLDYLGNIRPENKIINRIDFLNYFGTKRDFQKGIFEWIKIREK